MELSCNVLSHILDLNEEQVKGQLQYRGEYPPDIFICSWGDLPPIPETILRLLQPQTAPCLHCSLREYEILLPAGQTCKLPKLQVFSKVNSIMHDDPDEMGCRLDIAQISTSRIITLSLGHPDLGLAFMNIHKPRGMI